MLCSLIPRRASLPAAHVVLPPPVSRRSACGPRRASPLRSCCTSSARIAHSPCHALSIRVVLSPPSSYSPARAVLPPGSLLPVPRFLGLRGYHVLAQGKRSHALKHAYARRARPCVCLAHSHALKHAYARRALPCVCLAHSSTSHRTRTLSPVSRRTRLLVLVIKLGLHTPQPRAYVRKKYSVHSTAAPLHT